MKKELNQTLSEFMDFIREKGVIGLAVGIVIGTAVTALVQAVVDGLIDPLIGSLLPGVDDLKQATFSVGGSVYSWGAVTSALIDFIIIAAVIFFGFKWLKLDKADNKKDK